MLSPHFRLLEAAYQLHFYFCIKTHCLRQIFVSNEHRNLLMSVLEEVCKRQQYHLLDSRITPDHLRVLLSLRPEHAISDVVKLIKGNLSRQLNNVFPHDPERIWAKGYFARSSGKVDMERVRKYIESQAGHHGYKGEWTKELTYRNPSFKSPAFALPHSLCMLDYHLVLATNHRVPLFDESMATAMFAYLGGIGRKHGYVLDRVGLLPEHLHMTLEAIPSLSIEQCALAILNNTQHWMEKHYCGVLKQTGEWNVWQASFYAGTVGEYSTAQVKSFLSMD